MSLSSVLTRTPAFSHLRGAQGGPIFRFGMAHGNCHTAQPCMGRSSVPQVSHQTSFCHQLKHGDSTSHDQTEMPGDFRMSLWVHGCLLSLARPRLESWPAYSTPRYAPTAPTWSGWRHGER